MKTTKHCRACKYADMLQVEYAQDINVKGVDVHVSGLLAWECPECHAQVETAAQLDHNSAQVRAAFLARRAEYKRLNKLLTGEEIRSFRNSFALTQKEAAALFGGGLSAFSKYEAEDVVHSASMDKLLRLCKKHPQNIARLAEQSSIQLRVETKKKIREYSRLSFSEVLEAAMETLNFHEIMLPDASSANDETYQRFARKKQEKPQCHNWVIETGAVA